MRGIHPWSVKSPHKGQWRGDLMCSLITAWTNGWLSIQSRHRWFQTPLCSLWRHCIAIEMIHTCIITLRSDEMAVILQMTFSNTLERMTYSNVHGNIVSVYLWGYNLRYVALLYITSKSNVWQTVWSTDNQNSPKMPYTLAVLMLDTDAEPLGVYTSLFHIFVVLYTPAIIRDAVCWEDHWQVLNGEDKHKTNTSVQFNGDRATDVTRLLLVKSHVIGTYGQQLIW